MLRWKKDDNEAASLPRLQQAIRLLNSADFTTPDTVKAALWDYVEEVGRGELLWPLRVSLTGLERSPDPFTVAYIIGREETLSRIKTACDKIGE
jgi:glutamyl-tRNA synthetase